MRVDRANTWLWNFRWSLRDCAEAFFATVDEIDAFLERNNLRSLLKGGRR